MDGADGLNELLDGYMALEEMVQKGENDWGEALESQVGIFCAWSYVMLRGELRARGAAL